MAAAGRACEAAVRLRAPEGLAELYPQVPSLDSVSFFCP
jgi:hypothetical protein